MDPFIAQVQTLGNGAARDGFYGGVFVTGSDIGPAEQSSQGWIEINSVTQTVTRAI